MDKTSKIEVDKSHIGKLENKLKRLESKYAKESSTYKETIRTLKLTIRNLKHEAKAELKLAIEESANKALAVSLKEMDRVSIIHVKEVNGYKEKVLELERKLQQSNIKVESLQLHANAFANRIIELEREIEESNKSEEQLLDDVVLIAQNKLTSSVNTGGIDTNSLDNLRITLDLIQALHKYKFTFLANKVVPAEEIENVVELSEELSQELISQQEIPEIIENKEEIPGSVYGVFRREDFGGTVVLDNGEGYKLPEDMLAIVGLEHGAIVLCKPIEGEILRDGRQRYYFDVIMGGNDADSDIEKFLGYVTEKSPGIWSCINYSTKENYALSYKDAAHHELSEGDCCLFNIKRGRNTARISKILESSTSVEESGKVGMVKKASSTRIIRDKKEPFLDGSAVLVVGGQRKWFQTVVEETGAKLLHFEGNRSSLQQLEGYIKQSDIVYFLITALSHAAYWAAVEMSKEQGIPIRKIDGSKTSLSRMLEEDKELIKHPIKLIQ